MANVTSKQSKQVWKKVSKQLGAKIVYSRGWIARLRMRRIAKKKLVSIGLDKVDSLLNSRFITIRHRSKTYIFIPEKLGSKKIGGLEWCALCAHEHEHHLQAVRVDESGGNFLVDYLKNKSARALYEAQAEAAGAYVYRTLKHAWPNIDDVFGDSWREFYWLNHNNEAEARALYTHLIKQMKSGYVPSRAAMFTRKVLP